MSVQLQPGEAAELQQRRTDSPCRAVDQRALAALDLGGAMQHLVGGDVVEDEADGLPRVQARGHRHQVALRQADELGVGAVDRQRGDELPRLEARDPRAELIHHADQVPARREGHPRGLGVDPLAHHHVGQGDARR
jgi:hypothetical protein